MKNKMKKALLVSMGMVLLSSKVYAAPVPSISDPFPNAGTVYSGLDQERDWQPQVRKAEVKIDFNETKPAENESVIAVNGIAIEGQTVFEKDVLNNLIKDKLKKQMSFNELNEIALDIRMFFRRNGYFAAYVYIPKQTVKDGIITIKVIPGTYDKVVLLNETKMRTSRLEDFMKTIKSGSYIERANMDRSLLIMNDLPGIKVQATLKPGEHEGKADAIFKATTLEKQGGAIVIDNYGNRYTGRNRLGFTYYLNNPAKMGDQLFLYYMMTNGELKNYDARYEIPIDGFVKNGTVLGLSYTKMDYELGAPYNQYDAYGNAKTLQIYTKTPLKRMLHNNLYLRTSLEKRELTDRVDVFNQNTEKSSEVIRVALDGSYRTNKSASRYTLTQSVGWMHMDSETAKRYDYYNTDGPFQKTEFGFHYDTKFNNRLDFILNASGQYAWTNLDSSEKFYIGGYNGVRAFPQGEAGGDNGLLGTVETRWRIAPDENFQLAAFIDAGRVEYNKDSLEGDNFRNLAGWGLGLLWNDNKNTSARLDVAFPISDDFSKSDGKRNSNVWWFQLIQRI